VPTRYFYEFIGAISWVLNHSRLFSIIFPCHIVDNLPVPPHVDIINPMVEGQASSNLWIASFLYFPVQSIRNPYWLLHPSHMSNISAISGCFRPLPNAGIYSPSLRTSVCTMGAYTFASGGYRESSRVLQQLPQPSTLGNWSINTPDSWSLTGLNLKRVFQ
jgi:hypothetical protein